MAGNFLFGFAGALVVAGVIGFPVAVLLGLGRGWRGIGYGPALGLAVLLIACRGVQMLWPIGEAAWPMAGVYVAVSLGLWSLRAPRRVLRELVAEHRLALPALASVSLVTGVLICVPMLFGNAIQFEGTRNADSFTFTSSAQYMLTHTFHGAPDFSPERPVYTISRGYFGDGAMQPRPAAEGFLAWLSALRGIDPMYLYNAVQAAGVLIAGVAVLCFLPWQWRARKRSDWIIVLIVVAVSPALLHIAANSNFANALNLPAATAFAALVRERRSAQSIGAGVICAGCLLSGYPEMLPFLIAARGMCVVFFALETRSLRQFFFDAGSIAMEIVLAGVLLPWAALGTFATYKTTLHLSHVDASDLGGNMYAGLPAFGLALVASCVAWRNLARDTRAIVLGVLVAFVLGQLLMMHRGFGYGGYKLSEYFATLLAGVTILTLVSGNEPSLRERWKFAVAYVVALLLVVTSANVLRRAWGWSQERRVTADVVNAGRSLASLSEGKPVAMGRSPQPFYYGMWVAYVSSAPIAYDMATDADAAGYLSPYLHTTVRTAELYREASLQIDVAAPGASVSDAGVVARFGQVTIRTKTAPPAP